MKRRWEIRRQPHPFPCGGYWAWWRTSVLKPGGYDLVNCVCHHSWTQRVRSFVEVPDA